MTSQKNPELAGVPQKSPTSFSALEEHLNTQKLSTTQLSKFRASIDAEKAKNSSSEAVTAFIEKTTKEIDAAVSMSQKALANHRWEVSTETQAKRINEVLADSPLAKIKIDRTNTASLLRLLGTASPASLKEYVQASENMPEGSFENMYSDDYFSKKALASIGYTSNGKSDFSERKQVYEFVKTYLALEVASPVRSRIAGISEGYAQGIDITTGANLQAVSEGLDQKSTPLQVAEAMSSHYQKGVIDRSSFVKLYSSLLSTETDISRMAKFLKLSGVTNLATFTAEYQKNPIGIAGALRTAIEQAAALRVSFKREAFTVTNLRDLLDGKLATVADADIKEAEAKNLKLMDEKVQAALAEANKKVSDGKLSPADQKSLQEAISAIEKDRAAYTAKALKYAGMGAFGFVNPKGQSAISFGASFVSETVKALSLNIGATVLEGGKVIPGISARLGGVTQTGESAESTSHISHGITAGYAGAGFIALDGGFGTMGKIIMAGGGGLDSMVSTDVRLTASKGFGMLTVSSSENREASIGQYGARLAVAFENALSTGEIRFNTENLGLALKSVGFTSTNKDALTGLVQSGNTLLERFGVNASTTPATKFYMAREIAASMMRDLMMDEVSNTRDSVSSGGMTFGIGKAASFLIPLFGASFYKIAADFNQVTGGKDQTIVGSTKKVSASAVTAIPEVNTAEDFATAAQINKIDPKLLEIPGISKLFLDARGKKGFNEFQIARNRGERGIDELRGYLEWVVKSKSSNSKLASSALTILTKSTNGAEDALDNELAAANALTSGDALSRRLGELVGNKVAITKWIKNNPISFEKIRRNRLESSKGQFPGAEKAFAELYSKENFTRLVVESVHNGKLQNEVGFIGYDQTLGKAHGIDLLLSSARTIGAHKMSGEESKKVMPQLVSAYEQREPMRFAKYVATLRANLAKTAGIDIAKTGDSRLAKLDTQIQQIARDILLGKEVKFENFTITPKEAVAFASLASVQWASCFNAVVYFKPTWYKITRPSVPGIPAVVTDVPTESTEEGVPVNLPVFTTTTQNYGIAGVIDTITPVQVTNPGGQISTTPGNQVGWPIVTGWTGSTTITGGSGRPTGTVGQGTPIMPTGTTVAIPIVPATTATALNSLPINTVAIIQSGNVLNQNWNSQ